MNFKDNKIYCEIVDMLTSPNLFTILNLESKEIRHTNMLEWLLKINNYQGFYLLLDWLNLPKNNIDSKQIIIHNNKPFYKIFDNLAKDDKKMPDLLIEYNNGEKNYILIENKIDAFENKYADTDQTVLYKQVLDSIGINNIRYIFLNAKGNDPVCKEYKKMDYNTLYTEILTKLNLSDKENIILNEYVSSLKRPNGEIEFTPDTIYLVDNNYIKFFKEYQSDIENYIKSEIFSHDDSNYKVLKYIVSCASIKNIEIDKQVLDILELSKKYKTYNWSYKGLKGKNTVLLMNLCRDLITNNDIGLLMGIKVRVDDLITDNIDKLKSNESWIYFLEKHPGKTIYSYYSNIQDNYYLLQFIPEDIMEKVALLLNEHPKYKDTLKITE